MILRTVYERMFQGILGVLLTGILKDPLDAFQPTLKRKPRTFLQEFLMEFVKHTLMICLEKGILQKFLVFIFEGFIKNPVRICEANLWQISWKTFKINYSTSDKDSEEYQ